MSDRLGSWIGIVLILLIGVACAPVSSPTLAPPSASAILPVPNTYRIAFTSDRAEQSYFNIYSMSADGSNVTNMTQHTTSGVSSVCLCSLK